LSVEQLATAAKDNPAPLPFPHPKQEFCSPLPPGPALCRAGELLRWDSWPAVQTFRYGTACSQDRCLALPQAHSLPLSQPVKLSVPQLPLVQDSTETAIVRIFPCSECQENSSTLSFIIIIFALQSQQKNPRSTKLSMKIFHFFRHVIWLSFLSFSLCGKRGSNKSAYLLYVFVTFFCLQNIMFDRNNNLLHKKVCRKG